MTKGSPGAGCTNRQMSVTCRGMRQHRGEVWLRGRLVQRLFRCGQPPGQRHVEEPGLEHVGIAPAHAASHPAAASSWHGGGAPVRPRTAARGTDRVAPRRHRPAPAMAGRGWSRAAPGSRARRPPPARQGERRGAVGQFVRRFQHIEPLPPGGQPHRRLQRGVEPVQPRLGGDRRDVRQIGLRHSAHRSPDRGPARWPPRRTADRPAAARNRRATRAPEPHHATRSPARQTCRTTGRLSCSRTRTRSARCPARAGRDPSARPAARAAR